MLDDVFSQVFSDDVLGMLDKRECEAVVDAITLAMYADFDASEDEELEARLLLRDLPLSWDDEEAAEAYLKASMERAARLPDHELEGAMHDILDQVPGSVWPKLYEAVVCIVYADQDRNTDEDIVLEHFARLMGLDEDTVAGIEQSVTRFFQG